MMHPGADKMYHKLKNNYWCLMIKNFIAAYVEKCMTCLQINVEQQTPSGYLQQLKLPNGNGK
jgi:hypothetical protein